MSAIEIKGRAHELPSWWNGAGFTVRAGWVASLGVSYPEACAIVRGPVRRRPKRQVIDVERGVKVESFIREMDRRHLY